ncbi:MAG TPA: NUDIX hydrolase [Terriglobia bacterium]|nr:NUDIX hydrolase [Terriglobia bacterium]
MSSRARLIRSQTLYEGRVVRLKLDDVIEPGGIRATREVVAHPGSVVVMPCLADGRVVLVRQFRHAVGRSLWELVAGSLKSGERALPAARRELLEETGYRARKLQLLLRFFPSPGILSEEMHLVQARDLTLAKAQPEEDERIEVGRFSRPELGQMIASGTIRDGKTLIGLLWLLGPGKEAPGRRPGKF